MKIQCDPEYTYQLLVHSNEVKCRCQVKCHDSQEHLGAEALGVQAFYPLLLPVGLILPPLARRLQAADLVVGSPAVGFQDSLDLLDAPPFQLVIPCLQPVQTLLRWHQQQGIRCLTKNFAMKAPKHSQNEQHRACLLPTLDTRHCCGNNHGNLPLCSS